MSREAQVESDLVRGSGLEYPEGFVRRGQGPWIRMTVLPVGCGFLIVFW